MDIAQTIALTMGVGWASGINLYATVLTLGVLSTTGNITLPPELAVVADPMVMLAAGFMYMVEFFTDKTPGVDTAWDTLHTFIRIPAGALLAAAAVGDVGAAAQTTAFLVGGTLAAGTHATKTGTRVVINTSPEPFSNWTASIVEDVAVIGGMWAALNHPYVFLAALILFIAIMIWALPKLWRFIRRIFERLGTFFSGRKSTTAETPVAPASPVPPEWTEDDMARLQSIQNDIEAFPPDPGQEDHPPPSQPA